MELINSISLKSYLLDAAKRLPEGSLEVMEALEKEGPLNMDRISINAGVNRSSMKLVITPLETLGVIDFTKYGQAKEYHITSLGEEFLKLIKE